MNITNQIIQGDVLDALSRVPADSVDAGVTSPPYNKQEKHKGWLVENVVYDAYRDVLPEDEYQRQQVAVLDELYRITKPGGSFFYNHKVRWERGAMLHPMQWVSQSRWQIRQEIVWDRGIAANIRGWRFWQVEERVYWLCKPPTTIEKGKAIARELPSRYAKLTSVWRIRPEQDNPHPAPFPLVLPVRALASVLEDERALVIDPYAGSGTTLLAAKLLGHDYFGIDISEQYCELARDRVKAPSEKEHKAFNAEIATHQVQKTFSERKSNKAHVGRFATESANSEEVAAYAMPPLFP